MTRLTQNARDIIADAMLEERFKEELEALEKRKAQHTAKVYKHFYPAPLRRKMNNMPEGAFPTHQGMAVSYVGNREHIKFPEPVRLFHLHGWRHASIDSPEHPLFVEWKKLGKDFEAYRSSRADLAGELRQALKRFTTVASLLKNWPEAEPYVPKTVISANPPAVRTEELNRKLGLPK